MPYLFRGLAGILVAAAALGGDVVVRETGLSISAVSVAVAQQTETNGNGSVTGRVKRWTRERLEAAKKHWAEDNQRFSACVKELDEMKAKSQKRISYHRQGHFLDDCMRRKP